MKNKKSLIDYEFNLTGIDTFNMDFKMIADNDLVNSIFSKAKNALKKKQETKNFDLNVLDNPQNLERVDIDPVYYNVIRTSMKKYIKKVIEEVAKDNIIVTKYAVTKVYYEKETGAKDWLVYIRVGGLYVDKRFT